MAKETEDFSKLSLSQLEAKAKSLQEQMEGIKNAQKAAAETDLIDKKNKLDAAKDAYNAVAVIAGKPKLRLTSDEERETAPSDKPKGRKSGGKNIVLTSEAKDGITKIIKRAIKDHAKAGGIGYGEIIKEIDGPNGGYAFGNHYNKSHVQKIITAMLKGKEVKKEGDKGGTKYLPA